VTLRPFFAILIAAAMLFAPLAMQSGSAMAAMPADHHGLTTDESHCADQPANDAEDKSTGQSCCVAMCTAIAVAPLTSSAPMAFAQIVEQPGLYRVGFGFVAKLPTPPPRRA